MIELNHIDSVPQIADWIELNSIISGEVLSKSKLISLLEDNGYTEDAEYIGDEIFDSVLSELERREKLYGPNSPFKVESTLIQPVVSWQDYPEYVMCLIFSYLGASDNINGTKLFERLSQQVLKSYLCGEAKVIGFPNDENLTLQLDELAKKLFELRGNRDPDHHDKDRGVDVIGWKPFNDEKNSQIIVLMQCGAGWNWSKKKQIPLPAWAHFIHWNYTTTIQSISITEIIELKKWQKVVDEYGLVFDRARIVRCLYSGNFTIEVDLRNEIIAWCNRKLN